MRKNLINARTDKGLTQAELANLISTSERNYQYLEAGTSDGSLQLWQRISEQLNKGIDYLIIQEDKLR